MAGTISHRCKFNVDILMMNLRNKLGIFREDGDCNIEDKLEWGLRD